MLISTKYLDFHPQGTAGTSALRPWPRRESCKSLVLGNKPVPSPGTHFGEAFRPTSTQLRVKQDTFKGKRCPAPWGRTASPPSGPEENGLEPSERSLGVCRNKLGCSGTSIGQRTPISKGPQVRGAVLPAPQAAVYLVTDNASTGHGGEQKQNTSRVSDVCGLRTRLSSAPHADPGSRPRTLWLVWCLLLCI